MKAFKKLIKGIFIIAIILIAIFMGLIIWAVSSDDNFEEVKQMDAADTVANSNLEDEDVIEPETEEFEEVSEPEPEQEPIQEETKESDDRQSGRIYIGDTITYPRGELTIVDVGIVENDFQQPILYMEVEGKSTITNDVWTIKNSSFFLYIDDYQVSVDIGYRTAEEMNTSSVIEINPGRAGKYVYRAVLPPDYDSSSKIEIGFDGITDTLFIKDDGVYTYGQNTEYDVLMHLQPEDIIGKYAHLDDPSILLSVDQYESIVFTLESGSDAISVEMGSDGYLYIGTDEDAPIVGSFSINKDMITLSGMENSIFNGTYQQYQK